MSPHTKTFWLESAILALAAFGLTRSTVVELAEPAGTQHTESLLPSVPGSTEAPRIQMLRSPCTAEDNNFCMNGDCSYHPDLKTPTCRCPVNYTGERCQHILLDTHAYENADKIIAMSAGVALLLSSLAMLIYCCARCEKRKQPYQICRPQNAV